LNYGNNERCTFTTSSAGTLNVVSFNTESGYDELTVGGTQYDGTTGPQGVVVSAAAQITWSSDESETRAGFEICVLDSGGGGEGGGGGEDTTLVGNEVDVVDMNGLFNTVSNKVWTDYNTGNSIMANGDTAVLAVGSYKGSEGTCASSSSMLYTSGLNGEVKCVQDNASCVVDGENERRVMWVEGTGSGRLILRALTFDKGYADGDVGGGVYISWGALVDLKLCIFSNNRATPSNGGGGAIYVHSGTVNVYGSFFNGNTADSGDGDDIYRWNRATGTITIHNTCPSPYSSNTPIQGKTRMRIV
jgi:hypothetical protein